MFISHCFCRYLAQENSWTTKNPIPTYKPVCRICLRPEHGGRYLRFCWFNQCHTRVKYWARVCSQSAVWQKGRPPRAQSKQQNTLKTPARAFCPLSLGCACLSAAAFCHLSSSWAAVTVQIKHSLCLSASGSCGPRRARHKRMRRRRLLGNYLIANALSGGSSCIVCVGHFANKWCCVLLLSESFWIHLRALMWGAAILLRDLQNALGSLFIFCTTQRPARPLFLCAIVATLCILTLFSLSQLIPIVGLLFLFVWVS
jgi:hypothetical protein